MGLKDIGEALPPGFRFYPSDEELVCHYLHKKIVNEEALKGTLVDIDLHICEPWQLPEVAKLNGNEWYFFSFRDRKYATGYRTNRATTCGYWKATGKDRAILDPNTRQIVGMRKTLVFYKNRAPNGMKTGWIMHEFRCETPHMPPKEDWVLCRVFHKIKGDNGHDNPHLIDTTITTSISPNPTNVHLNTMAYNQQPPNPFASNPPSSQTLAQNYQQSTLDHSAMLSCSFNDSIMVDHLSKNDRHAHDDDGAHQLGLLWGMGFEENNNNNLLGFGIPHGHHHHNHHHEFYDVGEDGNGVVFL